MDTPIDHVNVQVSFVPFPTEKATETWTFTSEPQDGEVDEHRLEEELREAFIEAGGANTLTFQRSVTWGGWGAEGLRVLEIVISVSAGVASNALWASIVALYKKYVKRAPQADRMLPQGAPSSSPALPEPPLPLPLKPAGQGRRTEPKTTKALRKKTKSTKKKLTRKAAKPQSKRPSKSRKR